MIQGNCKPRITLGIVIMALMLLQLSAAYASTQYDLTDFLLRQRKEQASQALRDAIQPLNAMAEADDIRVTLTSGLCDGYRMSISWALESLDPERVALVELTSVQVNGQGEGVWAETTNLYEPRFLPRLHALGDGDISANPMYGGMTATFADPLPEGPIEVTLQITVSRPLKDLVIVDESLYAALDSPDYGEEAGADYQLLLSQLEQNVILLAPRADLDVAAWQARGYTVIDRHGYFWNGRAESENFGGHPVAQGFAEDTATLTVACALDVSHAQNIDMTPAKAMPFENGVLAFSRLLFTPQSMLIDMTFTPSENTEEAARSVTHGNRSYWYLLADAKGRPIDTLDIDWLAGWDTVQDEDGVWRSTLRHLFPAPIEGPHYIAVGSFGPFRRHEIEHISGLSGFGETIILPLAAE